MPTETPTETDTPTATPTDTVGPMADLVITSIEIGYEILPMCILGTETLGTRVSYRNQGTVDAGPFVVDLDGNTIEDILIQRSVGLILKTSVENTKYDN